MRVLSRCEDTSAETPDQPVARPSDRPAVFQIIVFVFLLKTALLAADPQPGFHFGDSGAYLATALAKWIPPDRSFTYGFLLRPLVVQTHSLIPVLLLQTTLSALASMVAGVILLRYFGASRRVAVCFSLLCAVEPLQLMSERFVMTEAVATFGFSLFVWACLEFLRSSNMWLLLFVQVIGVGLVSLRFSFIPVVLLVSVVLPLLSAGKSRLRSRPLWTRVALAIVASQLLLFGYRHLFGFLSHGPPAYLYRDGDFLAADMAPLITPHDFPIADERTALFQKIHIPLDDIDSRRLHRWVPGGICDAILQIAHGDEYLANQLARRTARKAMLRDPLGVVRVAAGTYREFLSVEKVEWALKLDQGQFVSPTADDVRMIRGWFGIDVSNRRFDSLTQRWERLAVPWCWLMVTLPLLYAVEIAARRPDAMRLDLMLLLTALCILGTAVVPVEIANPRYLTPLPWLSVLILGVMGARLDLRLRTAKAQSQSVFAT